MTTIAGGGAKTGGEVDGSGQRALPAARLYYPVGVAAAPDGVFLSKDEALMFASPRP